MMNVSAHATRLSNSRSLVAGCSVGADYLSSEVVSRCSSFRSDRPNAFQMISKAVGALFHILHTKNVGWHLATSLLNIYLS